jgi:hypothetical protein
MCSLVSSYVLHGCPLNGNGARGGSPQELQEARREMAVAEERTMVAKSTCAAAVLSSRERALKSPTSWFWASDEKDLKRALKPNASWPRMLFWSAR